MRWGTPWFTKSRHQSNEYLIPGRLEDVIALIQVLGLDEHVHRGEGALCDALTQKPASAASWCDLAKSHPEFFRTYNGKSVALIARHLVRGGNDDGKALTPTYIHGLVEAAIAIHQGQLQRKQVLRAMWVVIAFAILPGIGAIAAALINTYGR